MSNVASPLQAGADARPLARRLGAFVAERYPPPLALPLVAALAACGYFGAAAARGASPPWDGRLAAVATLLALAFFRLRIVDDLKDATTDRVARPERPLPRGLVTADELRAAALACAGGEIAIAAALGPRTLVAYMAALAFSLLAAADFFAPGFLGRRVVAAALAHSPVTPLLLGVAWWAYLDANANPGLGALMLLAWGASLGLEIGRKTLHVGAERAGVETYSSALGQRAAARLAASALAVGWLGLALYAVAAAPALASLPLAAACALAGVAFSGGPALLLVPRATPPVVLTLLLGPALLSVGRSVLL